MARRVFVFLGSALIAGCGGGGNPGALPAGSSGATSATTAAAFTIAVPPKSAQAKVRTPQFVSSNTQSVVITLATVNGNAYTGSPASIATNLTTANPACAPSGGNLVCTVSAPAVAGNDTFTINTYDALQAGSSPAAPVGNVLSTATVPLTVVAGTNTTSATPLVLNGIAATIAATFPADPHISGSAATGYTIVGNQPYTLTFTAKDASGATIVGPGSPTLATAGSAIAITAVNATTYTIQVKTYSATPINVTLSPLITGEPHLALSTVQELWVANSTGASVTGYALTPGAPAAIPADTITAGLARPIALAFDSSARLWVGDANNHTATQYIPGTNAIVATINGVGTATGVGFDPAGNIWVSDLVGNAREFAPANNATAIATIGGLTTPFGIAFAPNGNAWIASATANTILEFSGATATGAVITTGVNGPQAISFDNTGNLWASNVLGGTVTEYAAPLAGAAPIRTIATAFVDGSAFDADGNVYLTNVNTLSATALSASSGFTSTLPGFPLTTGTGPRGVAIAP